ncbi:hypothetical protein BKA67DRAFT_541218 [Truncatella angustata]|uniref:Uncharacterized protein n=1 Tax=Truncatella angustata TaxID=152316 RepID=A0A9P8RI17_9PEZI|nr:uncharacterized protein BKA67DRAFT_541218 [Truncatella angustata]KAH6646242.1 hypothetical protein BKA67DRAFT_541218 [Truncatella angustata]
MFRPFEKTVLSTIALYAAILCGGVHACGDWSNNSWTVQLPTATTPIRNEFAASITGFSDDGAYSIGVIDNAGSITWNNRTTQVIIRDQIPYGGHLVLYSLIGTNADEILEGWAYCTGGALTSLFMETTGGISGFINSTISGTCNVKAEATSVNLKTSSECLRVTLPSKVPTIDGGNLLSLPHGEAGNVTLGTQEFNLIPFAIVDCTNCSDAGPSGGWIEIHTVLTSKASADVCLGIFYLYLACAGTVSVQYVQCFEGDATSRTFYAGYDLSDLIGSSIEGVNTSCEASSSFGTTNSDNISDALGRIVPVGQLVALATVLAFFMAS